MLHAQNGVTRRIFLIGFMGAGKTSVGRALAKRLGWNFQDLDEVIENRQGTTIAQIFAQNGEEVFRKMEAAALQELLKHEPGPGVGSIVALGGGAFAQPENREVLRRAGGMVVLLEVPLQELRQRCAEQAGLRPLAADPDKFEALYTVRRAAYELAPWRVQNVNKTVEQAAAEIENLIAVGSGGKK